jgi:hypothetical protein
MARELAGNDLLRQETLDLLRQDIREMQNAGRAALALIPELSRRLQSEAIPEEEATRSCAGGVGWGPETRELSPAPPLLERIGRGLQEPDEGRPHPESLEPLDPDVPQAPWDRLRPGLSRTVPT